MSERGYWYNFRSGEYELRESPDDYSAYLPQNDAAQNLYRLYQEMGDCPVEAARKVLVACTGGEK